MGIPDWVSFWLRLSGLSRTKPFLGHPDKQPFGSSRKMNPGLDLSAALAIERDVDIEVRGYVPIRWRRADPEHAALISAIGTEPQ